MNHALIYAVSVDLYAAFNNVNIFKSKKGFTTQGYNIAIVYSLYMKVKVIIYLLIYTLLL